MRLEKDKGTNHTVACDFPIATFLASLDIFVSSTTAVSSTRCSAQFLCETRLVFDCAVPFEGLFEGPEAPSRTTELPVDLQQAAITCVFLSLGRAFTNVGNLEFLDDNREIPNMELVHVFELGFFPRSVPHQNSIPGIPLYHLSLRSNSCVDNTHFTRDFSMNFDVCALTIWLKPNNNDEKYVFLFLDLFFSCEVKRFSRREHIELKLIEMR